MVRQFTEKSIRFIGYLIKCISHAGYVGIIGRVYGCANEQVSVEKQIQKTKNCGKQTF